MLAKAGAQGSPTAVGGSVRVGSDVTTTLVALMGSAPVKVGEKKTYRVTGAFDFSFLVEEMKNPPSEQEGGLVGMVAGAGFEPTTFGL